ncbi:ArsR/SmtB family transcription factor [Planktotalea arctica]|uniref:ArsR/SmtB family transcription factor n=1 Tax=Planktotalea arctica TaxID=1481893 RepID=UPI000A177A15|nr:helix-turn-helix domain-containing protein [Planktotalea arctica]
MIESSQISAVFSALAHPLRVDILRALLQRAQDGLSAGELAARTQIAPSTLAHHLREMEQGQVITRESHGRKTIITPNLSTLGDIAALLTQLCCREPATHKRQIKAP